MNSDSAAKSNSAASPARRRRRKLAPGISQDAPNLKMQMPRITEKERQAQVVMQTRLLGYVVLELGQVKLEPIIVRCDCGRQHKRWPQASGTGNTIGTPDLCVSHTRWNGVSRFWEMKAPDGSASQHQQNLLDMGISIVIQNVDEAVEDLLRIETILRGPSQGKLIRWLRVNSQSRKGTWMTEDEERAADEERAEDEHCGPA